MRILDSLGFGSFWIRYSEMPIHNCRYINNFQICMRSIPRLFAHNTVVLVGSKSLKTDRIWSYFEMARV